MPLAVKYANLVQKNSFKNEDRVQAGDGVQASSDISHPIVTLF